MPIYTPSGKAREYSPRALNLFNGCDHDCQYCYIRKMRFCSSSTTVLAKANILQRLEKHLQRHDEPDQVLLSFLGDPYCSADIESAVARAAIKLLSEYRVPTAILTKGGSRCLRDLDIFLRHPQIKVGATLTFWNPADSIRWEPGAALPQDRIETLRELEASGIHTWVSFEPVVDPNQSLANLDAVLPFTHEVKLGKWNHDPRSKDIDWARFVADAVAMIESAPIPPAYYIKEDLAPFAQGLEIDPIHFVADSLALKRAA